MKNRFYIIALAAILFVALLFVVYSLNSKPIGLLSNGCKIPCWRQITPGKTHITEALNTIKKFSDVELGTIDTNKGAWNIYSDIVYFNLSSSEKVEIYLVDDVVAVISFSNPNGLIRLDECIKQFGDPEYATRTSLLSRDVPFFWGETYHSWFFAITPLKGVLYGYDTYGFWSKKRGSIIPDAMVTDISFFDTKLYEKLLNSDTLIPNIEDLSKRNLYLWKGYGDIKKLYP